MAREAAGPEGQVVPQWLLRTSARGVDPADRRLFDFVAYGGTLGEALCCDVTLVSFLSGPVLCCLA